MSESLTAVILAAGKGTRMKSGRAKVLHPLAGRTLIGHVLATAGRLEPEKAVVVLARDMEDVEAEVARAPLSTDVAIQDPPLGTGHALMAAQDLLPSEGDVLVLYGDTPLLTAGTLMQLLAKRREEKAAVAVFGIRPPDPSGLWTAPFRRWRARGPGGGASCGRGAQARRDLQCRHHGHGCGEARRAARQPGAEAAEG